MVGGTHNWERRAIGIGAASIHWFYTLAENRHSLTQRCEG
jgi:predicted secreted protein